MRRRAAACPGLRATSRAWRRPPQGKQAVRKLRNDHVNKAKQAKGSVSEDDIFNLEKEVRGALPPVPLLRRPLELKHTARRRSTRCTRRP